MKNSFGRKCHPIDIIIGKQLQFLRKSRGVSQKVLAEHVGLTFQQIQKYEKGLNRISCSKLCEFASFFKVDAGLFFKQLPNYLVESYNKDLYKQGIDLIDFSLFDNEDNEEIADNTSAEEDNYLRVTKESSILLDYFFKLQDKEKRWEVINLAKNLLLKN